MTLEEYIAKVKVENHLEFDDKEVLKAINEKAKTELKGVSGGIDDETIKNWILEFKPNEDTFKGKAVELTGDGEFKEVKKETPHTIKTKSWEMDSLL